MSELTAHERERGTQLVPKFDEMGLLSAVVVDSHTKDVLVVAFMNAEAFERTLESGIVHFWSRSRGRLWMKGETSGNVLSVEEVRVDCDQDAVVISARPAGPTCHTGETSCFYRRIERVGDGEYVLTPISR